LGGGQAQVASGGSREELGIWGARKSNTSEGKGKRGGGSKIRDLFLFQRWKSGQERGGGAGNLGRAKATRIKLLKSHYNFGGGEAGRFEGV